MKTEDFIQEWVENPTNFLNGKDKKCGNVFVEGDGLTLYDYGHHYPMCIYNPDQNVFYLNVEGHGPTTAKHISWTWRALHNNSVSIIPIRYHGHRYSSFSLDAAVLRSVVCDLELAVEGLAYRGSDEVRCYEAMSLAIQMKKACGSIKDFIAYIAKDVITEGVTDHFGGSTSVVLEKLQAFFEKESNNSFHSLLRPGTESVPLKLSFKEKVLLFLMGGKSDALDSERQTKLIRWYKQLNTTSLEELAAWVAPHDNGSALITINKSTKGEAL